MLHAKPVVSGARRLSGACRLMIGETMRYRLGMKDDGWLVVDTERRRVAQFGGLKLEGLSAEEAHIGLGLMEAFDRGVATGAEREPLPRLAENAGQDALQA